jgi:hypothetical protein
MAIVSTVTYQGYKALACSYRRSVGFNPERGSVDLNSADVANINIVGRAVPWVPANGQELAGQVDINTWKLSTGGGSPTVVQGAPTQNPQNGGFNQFGDLVFTTTGLPKDQAPLTYKNIYVDHSGLEELTKDLALVEQHDVGVIRVALTDIRIWYAKCGLLFGDINCRLKCGGWVNESTSDGSGTPWDITDVLEFLFALLPGSPQIQSYSQLYELAANLESPTDIRGKGEPVVEWIQKILDRAGLEAQMTPDNNWVVSGKYSPRPYKQVAGIDGANISIPTGGDNEGLSYEKKTSTPTGRPPAVLVHGGKIVKRGTFNYMEVLHDTDGLVYPMDRVLIRWGYTRAQLNNQIFNKEAKRFHDVPPTSGGAGDQTLHDKRRHILLKEAYKLYAPEFLLEASLNTQEVAPGGTTTGNKVPMQDPDRSPVLFLPMKDAPYYLRETNSIASVIPSDTVGAQGDADTYLLLPPIAYGNRVTQVQMTDMNDASTHFQNMTAVFNQQLTSINFWITYYNSKVAQLSSELSSMNDNAQINLQTSQWTDQWGVKHSSKLIKLDQDVTNALQDQGYALQDISATLYWGKGQSIVNQIRQWSNMVTQLQKEQQSQQQVLNQWNNNFTKYQAAYAQWKNFGALYNDPYKVLTGVHIDRHTGLLYSSEPLCVMDKPLFGDGDSATVIAGGNVMVTWGYELPDQSLAGYTAFLFVPDNPLPPDHVPTAVLAQVNKYSAVKALGVPMQSNLFVLDAGTPVNYTACLAEATQRAASLIEMPAIITGYTYSLHGFWQAALDWGISSVQHEYRDQGLGFTHVAAGSPGSRMPHGPAFITGKKSVISVDIREQLSREKEGGK